ncbi:MAG: hypothetical protein ACM679_09440 [Bacteroidales bacterium]
MKYQWLSTGVMDLPMLSNAEQCTDMCLFIQPVVERGWDMHR